MRWATSPRAEKSLPPSHYLIAIHCIHHEFSHSSGRDFQGNYSKSFYYFFPENFTLTTEELLQRIQTDAPSAIRFYQQHAAMDIGVLRELGKEHLSTPGVPLFLASMAGTPSKILEILEGSDDPQVLQQLALNPNSLARMAGSESEAARLAAASSRKLTQQQAQRLAEDASVAVRVELAKNPAIPTPVQLKLSQDNVPFVRIALLENRKLDEEFQVGLGDDIDTIVHLSALLVPRLAPACLKIWAGEAEELAQLALARRADLTPELVATISQSAFPTVLLALLEHQQISEESLADFIVRGDEATVLAILKRPELSPELQDAIWQRHGDKPQVRIALASHPSLADKIGNALCENADDALRQLLATNTSATLFQARLLLASQGGDSLLKLLLANPRCHEPQILDAIVQRASDETLCHLAYRQISCAQLSEESRARLRECPMPLVQRLA